MNTRRSIMILILVLTLFVTGCGQKKELTRVDSTIAVSVEEITRQTLTKEFYSITRIEAKDSFLVFPEMPGRVKEVFVWEGKRVVKGDKLYELDRQEISEKVAFNIKQHLADLKSAELNYKILEEQVKRSEILFDNNVLSVVELEDIKSALNLAKVNLDRAKKNYDSANINAQLALEKYIAYAPIDGIISNIDVKKNEQVNPGQGIKVIDSNTMVAKVPIPYHIVVEIDKSTEGSIYLPDANVHINGKVLEISEEVNELNNTYMVTIELLTDHKDLRNGMYAEVSLEVVSIENQYLVPHEALVFEENIAYIYKLEEDKPFSKVRIEKGIEQDGYVQVVGRIKDGDQVIVKGQHFLTKSSKLVVVENKKE